MAAKKKKEELTALQTLGYYFKEIISAFLHAEIPRNYGRN